MRDVFASRVVLTTSSRSCLVIPNTPYDVATTTHSKGYPDY